VQAWAANDGYNGTPIREFERAGYTMLKAGSTHRQKLKDDFKSGDLASVIIDEDTQTHGSAQPRVRVWEVDRKTERAGVHDLLNIKGSCFNRSEKACIGRDSFTKIEMMHSSVLSISNIQRTWPT